MKRIIYILILCGWGTFCFCNQANAQNYIPLLNDSLYWDTGMADNLNVTFCQEYGVAGNGPYRYKTLRDTVFNAAAYKMFAVYPFHKIYPSYPYNCPPFYVDTLFYEMVNGPYLREDTSGRKVFILDSANATERIMFDFNAQIGDTIHYPVQYTIRFMVILLLIPFSITQPWMVRFGGCLPTMQMLYLMDRIII
jgi:hypothetical protein